MGKSKSNKQKSLYSVFIIILFVAFALATDESDTSSSSQRTSDQSIEYKLAVIDGHPTPSDEVKRRYGRALDLLERYCPENRESIADMTVQGQELLKERNIDETLLQLLHNFQSSIPDEASPGELGNCSEIFSAYVILRIESN